MMTATFAKLSGAMLTDRIDATYYRPEYIANEMRLRRSGLDIVPLSSLVKSGRRAVYFDTSTLEGAAAPSDWLPFLTADDFGADGFFLNLNARRRVSPGFAARYPNGLLRANELLVKVKGPNQITAYNECEPDQAVLVSGTIWGALVRRECVDPYYLVTALSSEYAATARTRLRTNLNVEFLSSTDLMSLDLPLPQSKDVQKYIGDKVRHAARLRALTFRLDRTVLQYFDTYKGSLNGRKHSWRIEGVAIDPYRINAPHYDYVVLEMLSYARTITRLVPLRDIVADDDISGGATPLGANYGADGVFFARVQNVSTLRIDRSDAAYLNSDQDEELRRSRCRANDIILTITGYPGSAAVVSEEDLPLNINQHSVRFAVKEEWYPGFVAAAINSDFGRRQVDRLAIGGTRDALDYPSVKSLLIPESPRSDRQRIDNLVEVSNRALRCAGRLTMAAKMLVEALIEGRISEAELISAQQSLERGDEECDRAVLSRLTQAGADVADKPGLFPDLDALYEAIEDSQRTETCNGDAT
ncbi:MAG: hypothetical protein GXY83_16660 [Rhodopirellula sp.]|nr:hypothetical protein [Rhodopirellula sp.]